jgi:hypothetical protein
LVVTEFLFEIQLFIYEQSIEQFKFKYFVFEQQFYQ